MYLVNSKSMRCLVVGSLIILLSGICLCAEQRRRVAYQDIDGTWKLIYPEEFPEWKVEKQRKSTLIIGTTTCNISYGDNFGTGFWDLYYGSTRRDTLESVLMYIFSVIKAPGAIDISVVSFYDYGSLQIGGATTFFSENAGISNGFAYDHLTTGYDPVVGLPDVYVRINFGNSVANTDLFSILLHEFTHTLGIINTTKSDGTSNAIGTRSKFESLYVGPHGPLFDESGNFIGNISDLTSGQIYFTGQMTTTRYGENPRIYTPSPWEQGSSFCHWHPDSSRQPVMVPVYQESRHKYADWEIEALVDIGYQKNVSAMYEENFEGAWPSGQWQLWDSNNPDVGWGKTSYRKASGTYSVWCAKSGTQSPGDGGNVPANAQSWMWVGPLNFSDVQSGAINFDLWLEAETGYDFLFFGASNDDVNYSWGYFDVSTNGFEANSIDLNLFHPDPGNNFYGVLGQSQVWFAWVYNSNQTNNFEGAYIDNIEITTGGIGQTASCRYVSTNREEYDWNDTVQVTYDIDTTLSSQSVRVETRIIAPDSSELQQHTQTYTTSGTTDDPKTIGLKLPASGTDGMHTVQVTVYDSASGKYEASSTVLIAVGIVGNFVSYLPHFAEEAGVWNTKLTVTNGGDDAEDVYLQLYDDAGTFYRTEEFTLPANGGISQLVREYFPGLGFTSGWIKIISASELVQGIMKFSFLPSGGTSSLPTVALTTDRIIFPLMEIMGDWVSAFAVINTEDTTANCIAYAYGYDGTPMGTYNFNVPPMGKYVNYVSAAFPGALPEETMVIVESTTQITGFALLHNSDISGIVAIPSSDGSVRQTGAKNHRYNHYLTEEIISSGDKCIQRYPISRKIKH